EGLRDDVIPSLARLGELGQLGDLPSLIAELARQLEEPDSLALAARVRAHAQEREAIGFAPREIVAEFLLLRRVLAQLASGRIAGHPEGDRVLRLVAHLVRERLRRSDLAGRMGGDEFAVALIESDGEAGGQLLARIDDAIAECVAREELPPGFAISPGLAHFPT